MVEKGKTYDVYDGEGRHWGKVCLDYPFNDPILGAESISGYLKTHPGFDEVRHIFSELENAKSSNEAEKTSKIIANLGVVLVDPETGEEQNVGPVFVSEKLLFTCDANVKGI